MAVSYEQPIATLKKGFEREVLIAAFQLARLVGVVIHIGAEKQLSNAFVFRTRSDFKSRFRFREIPAQEPAHFRVHGPLHNHSFDFGTDEIGVPNRASASGPLIFVFSGSKCGTQDRRNIEMPEENKIRVNANTAVVGIA